MRRVCRGLVRRKRHGIVRDVRRVPVGGCRDKRELYATAWGRTGRTVAKPLCGQPRTAEPPVDFAWEGELGEFDHARAENVKETGDA